MILSRMTLAGVLPVSAWLEPAAGAWLSAASAPTDQPAHDGYRGQVSPTKPSSQVAFIHRGVKAGKTRGQWAGEAENSPWLVHCADRISGNPEVDYGGVLTGSG
jgi:hypothetical protein